MERNDLLRTILRRLYNSLKSINIIMAHHVTNTLPFIDSCIISKQNFSTYITHKKFIPISDALTSISKNHKSYVLTVDDALDDLYTEIYPFCKKHNIPFTAFISAELLDKPGYITSEQLKEMAKNPLVTIGSHGCTHIKLNSCYEETARYEIFSSKEKIEKLINKKVDLIAYPNGAVNKRVLNLAKKAGYKYGFGVTPRKFNIISKHFNKFLLPRYNLTNDTVNSLD